MYVCMFLDDLIDRLKARCDPDDLLDDRHCLLHADDTVVLSTKRESFIHKCNETISYFHDNLLTMNMSKSGYMIINGKNCIKSDIELDSGILKYVSSQTYIGVIFTDTGKLAHDVSLHAKSKRPSITIKLVNFIRKNCYCPVWAKLKIMDTCINASLL